LEQLDRRKLEAAYDLGATPWKTFWHVTLPLTKSGVITGSILVFVSSIGMFVVPDVMGGAKSALMGNVIQNQFLSARDWPFGSALSIVLMLLSMVLIYLYYRAVNAAEAKEGTA
ncbi:ABC transporter permease, partial [Brevibacillus borstelensis]